MIRVLTFAVVLLFNSNVLSQDVLFLGDGAQMIINNGASLTVQGGIQAMSGSKIIHNGYLVLHNNGIANQSNWTDANTSGVFHSRSSGMVFFNGSHGHIITGNTIFPSVTMYADGNATLANDVSIRNNLILATGLFNTAAYELIILNDAASAVQPAPGNPAYTLSWINGTLVRKITANTATYDFPTGNSSRGNLLQFVNNNVFGPSDLTVSFGEKRGTDAGLVITENGTLYTEVNNGGVWYLNSNGTITGGSYALKLFFKGFEGLIDNQFGILRRNDESTNAADWSIPAGSYLEPTNGPGRKVGDGYAERLNIINFSQLGIGMTAVVLPITLLNFSAVRESGTTIKIEWSTALEVNNKGFEIERRLGNETGFSYKGFETSKANGGNSQGHLDYTFRDVNSFPGISYYRIKQIDLDNNFSFTGIKAVKGIGNTSVNVNVMPNPGHGQFKINITGVTQSYQAFLIDLNGKIVKKFLVSPGHELNITGLSPAIYILTIKDVFGNGENFKEKIMIIK